jgi:hypothetical protein
VSLHRKNDTLDYKIPSGGRSFKHDDEKEGKNQSKLFKSQKAKRNEEKNEKVGADRIRMEKLLKKLEFQASPSSLISSLRVKRIEGKSFNSRLLHHHIHNVKFPYFLLCTSSHPYFTAHIHIHH